MSAEIISASEPVTLDGLPAERRTWAAAAIFIALAMASLDTAIANIALPAIAAGLHAGPADVIWVVNVYQIAMVATLLPLAALGEVVGHRRIYLGGLLLFTLASLFCACAWSLPSLLMPLGNLAALIAGPLLALWSGQARWLLLPVLTLATTIALRASRMSRAGSANAVRDILENCAVASTYEMARAVAMVARASHGVRRGG